MNREQILAGHLTIFSTAMPNETYKKRFEQRALFKRARPTSTNGKYRTEASRNYTERGR